MNFVIKDPRSAAQSRLSGASSTHERLAFLNAASTRIGSTLDLTQTCRELVDVAVPQLADVAGVIVQERLVAEGEFPARPRDGSALLRRVATGVAVPNPWDWDTAFPAGSVVVYPPTIPQSQPMVTGKTVLIPRMDAGSAEKTARAFEQEIITKVLPGCSFLGVPLLARGNVLGFVALVRQPQTEPFQQSDAALAEELAARTAICIDNARLYGRERRTALMLQSSLLPSCPYQPPGLEIAHRYLPASDLAAVGGDWFDVIPLPAGRTALVVGDVMGHGIRAAATMGQLRTASATLAALDFGPGELLHKLNGVAGQFEPDQIATCLYATYDEATRTCAMATAGHVAPVLRQSNGMAQPVEVAPGPPLGIGQGHFETCEITLPAGSVLALYTDGLVESREREIDDGVAALCSLLSVASPSLDSMCDTIISLQRPSTNRDDIALLLAKTL